MKIAFITTFCPHYRQKTFEMLSAEFPVDYYFFSAGDEWYWQLQHGVKKGFFRYEYLRSYKIGQTKITPSLFNRLGNDDYDVLVKCINGKFALLASFLVSRIQAKPFVLWTGVWVRLPNFFHRFFFFVTRYIYSHSDAIVVYGDHVKRYLISEGIKSEKIFVAPHAVDNEVFNQFMPQDIKNHLRGKLNIDPEKKIILYLGRLEPIKGLEYLIEAFQAINDPQTVLVLAGSGSLERQLVKKVKDLNLTERVRFTGYVSQEETVAYYAIAYVLVLASITDTTGRETWGLVVNEAFNQGCPVIATESVGAAAGGLVENAINGFIVPERDSLSLSKALRAIISDSLLREFFSKNAKIKISRWDNLQMIRGFSEAIKSVTEKE